MKLLVGVADLVVLSLLWQVARTGPTTTKQGGNGTIPGKLTADVQHVIPPLTERYDGRLSLAKAVPQTSRPRHKPQQKDSVVPRDLETGVCSAPGQCALSAATYHALARVIWFAATGSVVVIQDILHQSLGGCLLSGIGLPVVFASICPIPSACAELCDEATMADPADHPLWLSKRWALAFFGTIFNIASIIVNNVNSGNRRLLAHSDSTLDTSPVGEEILKAVWGGPQLPPGEARSSLLNKTLVTPYALAEYLNLEPFDTFCLLLHYKRGEAMTLSELMQAFKENGGVDAQESAAVVSISPGRALVVPKDRGQQLIGIAGKSTFKVQRDKVLLTTSQGSAGESERASDIYSRLWPKGDCHLFSNVVGSKLSAAQGGQVASILCGVPEAAAANSLSVRWQNATTVVPEQVRREWPKYFEITQQMFKSFGANATTERESLQMLAEQIVSQNNDGLPEMPPTTVKGRPPPTCRRALRLNHMIRDVITELAHECKD